MEEVPTLPADLTDEQHQRMLAPAFLRRRQNGVQDPIMLAKSDRLSELRQDDRPIALHELEVARNRAVRQMVRRLPEMKPQEVMTCVEVLDAEIAARKIAGAEAPEKREVTREEMLQTLQGSKQKEVQK